MSFEDIEVARAARAAKEATKGKGCQHVFYGICVARILRDGTVEGSSCPMCRGGIPSLLAMGNTMAQVERPTEFLRLLAMLADDVPDVYLRQWVEMQQAGMIIAMRGDSIQIDSLGSRSSILASC